MSIFKSAHINGVANMQHNSVIVGVGVDFKKCLFWTNTQVSLCMSTQKITSLCMVTQKITYWYIRPKKWFFNNFLVISHFG